MGDNSNVFNNKRSRDEAADSPDSKRIREILEDDGDAENPVDDDLDDVIRSLEEEIKGARGSPPRLDIGHLLEASDDELGIPPAVGYESPPSVVDGGDPVGLDDGGSGFDRIWGFEDEGPGFGIGEDGRGIFGNGDLWDGAGLLDCCGSESGPLDYENL